MNACLLSVHQASTATSAHRNVSRNGVGFEGPGQRQPEQRHEWKEQDDGHVFRARRADDLFRMQQERQRRQRRSPVVFQEMPRAKVHGHRAHKNRQQRHELAGGNEVREHRKEHPRQQIETPAMVEAVARPAHEIRRPPRKRNDVGRFRAGCPKRGKPSRSVRWRSTPTAASARQARRSTLPPPPP